MAHWKKRETVFAEYELELTMPGAWQLRPSDDPCRWIYRSPEHREHVTISRGEALRARNKADEGVLVQRALLRNRRAVELEFGRAPGFELEETEYGEKAGASAGWFHGVAGPDQRFWSITVCPEDAVWSVFYQTLKLREADAEEKARAILDSIRLK